MSGNRLKGVLVIELAEHLSHASLQRRVLPTGKLDTSIITLSPCLLQADLRINAKRQAPSASLSRESGTSSASNVHR